MHVDIRKAQPRRERARSVTSSTAHNLYLVLGCRRLIPAFLACDVGAISCAAPPRIRFGGVLPISQSRP